jgi:hypothetical protein
MKEDVIAQPIIGHDGHLIAARVEVDSHQATKFLATSARQQWWDERITRIWSLIDESLMSEWGWSFLS